MYVFLKVIMVPKTAVKIKEEVQRCKVKVSKERARQISL